MSCESEPVVALASPAFRRRLTAWYGRSARALPWRADREAYRVWLSEIMLQQTQVATVAPYFERFLKAFPSIAALAAADEHDVLRLWEGLGYYRRARQLHQAARRIVQEHGGRFPRDAEAVRSLPGIGRYTAGAILSIAFDQRQPILEANTTRLFCRLLAYRGDPATREGRRLLWSAAEAVLPVRGSGRVNQALMELGSAICHPRQPRCEACPVRPHCRAAALGLVESIPAGRRKPPPIPRHEAALVVRRRGRVLLLRCGDGGRWAGLWDFPRYEVSPGTPAAQIQSLAEQLHAQTGVCASLGRRLLTLRHGVTRFRITLDCYEAECVRTSATASRPALRWLRPGELATYALNSTGRRIARLLGPEGAEQ